MKSARTTIRHPVRTTVYRPHLAVRQSTALVVAAAAWLLLLIGLTAASGAEFESETTSNVSGAEDSIWKLEWKPDAGALPVEAVGRLNRTDAGSKLTLGVQAVIVGDVQVAPLATLPPTAAVESPVRTPLRVADAAAPRPRRQVRPLDRRSSALAFHSDDLTPPSVHLAEVRPAGSVAKNRPAVETRPFVVVKPNAREDLDVPTSPVAAAATATTLPVVARSKSDASTIAPTRVSEGTEFADPSARGENAGDQALDDIRDDGAVVVDEDNGAEEPVDEIDDGGGDGELIADDQEADDAEADDAEADDAEADDAEASTAPPEPPVRINRRMAALRPRIERVLSFYRDRPLNTRDDSAWSIMHSFLGYGINAPLAIGGKDGRRTNAIGWLCWNNPCAGRQLLFLKDGDVVGREGPGYQGHPAQFLAMLAQVRLKENYPLRVEGQLLTVADLVRSEQKTCYAHRELTFKLIALSHYLDSDAEWENEKGEKWNLPKMLQIEMSQPVKGAACGGTHRVMACSFAVWKRERRGEPLDGPYLRAQKYTRDYQRYALTLQNRDGSFSSDWFKGRADWGDEDRQLQTTGHILEWLVFSLPRNQLAHPRVVYATEFLANLMTEHRYHEWEVGPRGHALRALSLYRDRVFGQTATATPMARRPQRRAQ